MGQAVPLEVIAFPQTGGAPAYPMNGGKVVEAVWVATLAYGDYVVCGVRAVVSAPYACVGVGEACRSCLPVAVFGEFLASCHGGPPGYAKGTRRSGGLPGPWSPVGLSGHAGRGFIFGHVSGGVKGCSGVRYGQGRRGREWGASCAFHALGRAAQVPVSG